MDHFSATKLEHCAIAGPFTHNPFHQLLIYSPLQPVPKRGTSGRRAVMDLSFPPSSVNCGIPDHSYLDDHYKLRLPDVDRLCQIILQHDRGCF